CGVGTSYSLIAIFSWPTTEANSRPTRAKNSATANADSHLLVTIPVPSLLTFGPRIPLPGRFESEQLHLIRPSQRPATCGRGEDVPNTALLRWSSASHLSG